MIIHLKVKLKRQNVKMKASESRPNEEKVRELKSKGMRHEGCAIENFEWIDFRLRIGERGRFKLKE